MKIGVMSDSHGNLAMVEKAFSLFKELDCVAVIHLGDCLPDVTKYEEAATIPLFTVPGNCDLSRGETLEKVITLGGMKIFLCHGHTLGVTEELYNLYLRAAHEGCQVALFGHTHLPLQTSHNEVLFLNPGSCAKPRGRSKRSAGILTIENGRASTQVYWLDEPVEKQYPLSK